MTAARKSVAKLLNRELIRELARPSDLRYGQAIFRRGGVEFIEFGSATVEAWIGGLDGSVSEGGGQRRRTRLYVTARGLAWRCAGNPKNHQIFCKHCVAPGAGNPKARPAATVIQTQWQWGLLCAWAERHSPSRGMTNVPAREMPYPLAS